MPGGRASMGEEIFPGNADPRREASWPVTCDIEGVVAKVVEEEAEIICVDETSSPLKFLGFKGLVGAAACGVARLLAGGEGGGKLRWEGEGGDGLTSSSNDASGSNECIFFSHIMKSSSLLIISSAHESSNSTRLPCVAVSGVVRSILHPQAWALANLSISFRNE